MPRPAAQYSHSQGLKLLEAALQNIGPLFTIESLAPLASERQISRRQLIWLMSMLNAAGKIEILKRGVYAITSPLFEGEISPLAIASALAQPAAISHWSALAHHGFTTQIPSMVQASTPRKIITPEMRNGQAHSPRGRAVWKAHGIDVEFIHVQQKHFFGHQTIWADRWHQVAVTDPERTALDLIARAGVFGGMRAAAEILENVLQQVNLSKLVKYVLYYDTGSVAKRMGWLMERFGVPESKIIPLLDYPVNTYYPLDPRTGLTGNYQSRWHIVENMRKP